MELRYIILAVSLFLNLSAQSLVKGVVNEVSKDGKIPLVGANIIWMGTTVGTTSDDNGNFSITKTELSNKLIVSFIGYQTDTVIVTDEKFVEVNLILEDYYTDEISVVGKTASTIADFSSIENKSIITTKELKKQLAVLCRKALKQTHPLTQLLQMQLPDQDKLKCLVFPEFILKILLKVCLT